MTDKLPIHTVVDRNGDEHTFDEDADGCSYWFHYGNPNGDAEPRHDVLYVQASGPLRVVAEFYQPRQLRTIWE